MNAAGKKNIDVTRYVALGDSITSGYTDGALSYYGQLNSYPKLIADQFKLIGGGIFKQPLIDPNSVGVGFSGTGKEKHANDVVVFWLRSVVESCIKNSLYQGCYCKWF